MESISDIMTKEVFVVSEDASAVDAAHIMTRKGVGALVVVKDESPVGMVTERDLVRRILAEGKNPEQTKLSSIASKPLVVVDPSKDLDGAAKIMTINNVRRLAVIQEGRLRGIITATDLARNLGGKLSEYDAITAAMARYHKSGYRDPIKI